jgi:hypothetical protein
MGSSNVWEYNIDNDSDDQDEQKDFNFKQEGIHVDQYSYGV